MAFFKTKFESHKQEWETPAGLFDRLNREFGFTLDLAADATNAKCSTYYTSENDALKLSWHGVCWLNPPYGAKQHRLSDWVRKAFREAQTKAGCKVVMLIPARTNTRWWHDYCMKAAEIRFINGRLKFGDAKHGLPQPLALVVFRPHDGSPVISSFEA